MGVCKHNIADLEDSTLCFIHDDEGWGYMCSVCKTIYIILLIDRANKKPSEWGIYE